MNFSFKPSEAQLALQSVCVQSQIHLDDALYWIAKDEDPTVSKNILDQLDVLADQIHLPDPSDTLDSICRINHHLFTTLEFSGDTEDYYHPYNSQLHKVLERKCGLPISLGVLYIEVARRLNIEVQGIGFPKHFLIQPTQCTSRPFYIDPFDKGNILTEEDLRFWHEHWGIDQSFKQCLKPSSHHEIILRMCHNIFYAHNRLRNFEGMLRSLERLMLLQPNLTKLHRTRSVVLGQMHRYPESVDALELYMLCHPDAQDIPECQQDVLLLKQLYGKKHL